MLKTIDALAPAGVSSRLDGWRKEFASIPAAAPAEFWQNLEERLTTVEDALANFSRYRALSKDKQAFLDKDFYLAAYPSLQKVMDRRRLTPGFAMQAELAGAGGEVLNFQAAAISAPILPVSVSTVTVLLLNIW